MLWIYLIILQVLFFVGLLYFLRYVLARNISKATGHLQELSKDYVSKEEEANQILQRAQKEAKSIVAKEKQDAEEVKEKLMKEAQELREKMISEAQQKSSEIAEKAERNAEFLRNELDQKIEERTKEKICPLVQKAVPQKVLKSIHEHLVDESDKGELDLKHLKVPEKVKEAEVVSAFPLTDKRQEDLRKKLKKKTGTDIKLKVETDPSLLAGFTITIGSVVVDASLKYKIQKTIQEQ